MSIAKGIVKTAENVVEDECRYDADFQQESAGIEL